MPMYETTVRTPQGEEKKRIYADTPQEAKKLFETLYVWYYNTVPKEHHAVRHSVSVIEPSVLNTVYCLQRTTIIVRFGLEIKKWK